MAAGTCESEGKMKDFILVGEFCEVYGPRAVLTIPSTVSSLNNNQHFNLEEFLLYIMTTDYQNFSGEKWEKAADVCCMRTNILPQFHAILHYFTLKDPSARGCVRPSCIAYVSQNQIKLYHLKKEIMSVLNISAQIFKHANMRWMRSIGRKVEIPEDVKLKELLQKWNLLQANISSEADLGRQQLWTKLCPTALSIVVSGLLQFYRTSSPSLKELILEHQEIFSGLDLFDCVLSEDGEFCAIIQSCQ